jgi:hypothetical protein
MIVSSRQCDRLLRPLAATAMPRDRGARPATSTRASRATHHRGHGICRHDHADAAAANTRSHPADRGSAGTNSDRAPAATPPVDVVQARSPLRHRHGHLRIPARAARPHPCTAPQSSVHPQTGDRTGATSQPADSTTDRALLSKAREQCAQRIVHIRPRRCTARPSDRPSGQSETAAANSLLHCAPGELHPRTDDRAVARAQQAGQSP